MNPLQHVREMLESPLVHRLGWTLLHSLWEGAAVALLLALVLALLARRSPQARYLASCGALLAMALLPVATFILTPAPDTRAPPNGAAPEPVADGTPSVKPANRAGTVAPAVVETHTLLMPSPLAPGEARRVEPDMAPREAAAAPARVEVRPKEEATTATAPTLWRRALARLQPLLPWAVVAWIAGVLLLSLYQAGGWLAMHRLTSLHTAPVGGAVAAAADRLGRRLGLRRAVRLLQSAVVESPLVIGAIKPVILLPASLLTDLTPAQIEAILVHELAHVRRHDYVVNLLQSVVETLLFFHPATWWISRRIRAEREHCCDDAAVQLTQDRKAYARALATVAARQARPPRLPALAPAAASGALLGRIRRLLTPPAAPAAAGRTWLTAAVLGLCAVAAVVSAAPLNLAPPPFTAPTAPRDARPQPAPHPADAASGPDERVARAIATFHMDKPIDDPDAWLPAMQDLLAVGRSAVPALAAELEKADRSFEQAAFSMLLRSIGDRRAVPALIHALARCKVRVSDYGLLAVDPELHLLLMRLDKNRRAGDRAYGTAGFGRPIREVTAALEALTGHTEGSAHLRMYDDDGNWPKKFGPFMDERERQLARVTADRWHAWWESNKAALLTPEELAWVDAHAPKPFAAPPAEPGRTLTLSIAGAADDKPLAKVALDVWSDRLRYSATTDAAGVATLPLPKAATDRISVIARRDGFVPTMLFWAPDQPVPARHTLKLAAGTTVGGTVTDPAGKPVEGAAVFLLAPQQMSDNAWADLLDAPATSDAAGNWRIAGVPADLSVFAVRVAHPRYVSDTGYDTSQKVPLDDLKRGKARLKLRPVHRVRGRVVDVAGNPISGARVAGQGKEAWRDQYPDLTTDAEGRFSWPDIRPGPLTVAVQATGYGPATVALAAVGPDVGELSVRLDAGRVVQGIVADPEGVPIADAQVVLSEWQGHHLNEWATKTSPAGTFLWPNAPADKVTLAFYRSGFEVSHATSDPAPAAGKPLTVSLQPALRVEGTVVDDASGKPLERFVVMPGMMSGEPPQPFVHRQQGRSHAGGRFVHTFSRSHTPSLRDRAGNDQLVRVEAAGYLPVVSRPLGVRDGLQKIEFRMKRGADVAGRVVGPDGAPVAGADVLLGTAVQPAYVTAGRYPDYTRREGRNLATTTDAEGRFAFPPQIEPFAVIVLHDRGLAQVTREQLAGGDPVRLAPWGRVEGTLLIEGKPAAENWVRLWDPLESQKPRAERWVEHNITVQTDAAGRFTFDRIQPGSFRLGSSVPVNPVMSTTTPGIPVSVRAGQAVRADLGGEGRRPVTGRLTAPHVKDPIDWSGAKVRLHKTTRQGDPTGEPVQEVTPGADGTFRLADVPAGVAAVEIEATLPPLVEAGGETRRRSGKGSLRFEVPGGVASEALDLGQLPLAVSTELAVGDVAPAFKVRTLDGKQLALADFRGKYVLLDFWAVWCGPCVAEIPHLKAAHDAFGKDPRFVMVSLSLDFEPGQPKGFVRQHEMNWPQGFLGEWSGTPLPGLYGVQGIPATFLIGPDGKVLARNLRGDAVRAAVEKALKDDRQD